MSCSVCDALIPAAEKLFFSTFFSRLVSIFNASFACLWFNGLSFRVLIFEINSVVWADEYLPVSPVVQLYELEVK